MRQSHLCGEIPLTFRAIRDVDPKLLHMSHVLLLERESHSRGPILLHGLPVLGADTEL